MSSVPFRKLARVTGLGALLLASVLSEGTAQDTPPTAPADGPAADRELTLTEALEIAARGNPAYRRELNQLELAGPQRQQVIGDFLPGVRPPDDRD